MKFNSFTALGLYLLETIDRSDDVSMDAEGSLVFDEHFLAVYDRLVRWLVSRANRGLVADIMKTYNFHNEWMVRRKLAWKEIRRHGKRGTEAPDWLKALVEIKSGGPKFYYSEPTAEYEQQDHGEDTMARAAEEGRIMRRFYDLTPAQIFRLARGLEVAEQTPNKHTVTLKKGTKLSGKYKVLKDGDVDTFSVKLDCGAIIVAAKISDHMAFFTKRFGNALEAKGIILSYWKGDAFKTWLA